MPYRQSSCCSCVARRCYLAIESGELSMLDNLLQAAIIVNILASTIRIATPLLLGAMGELVTERSGVMNLGIEGTMLMSSYVAFLVDFETNSIVLAIIAAMLTGAFMSWIVGF